MLRIAQRCADQGGAFEPDEAIATMNLPSGFHMEVAATEPLVEHPVTMTFDPDGRLWVVEMRSYMPNVEGMDGIQQMIQSKGGKRFQQQRSQQGDGQGQQQSQGGEMKGTMKGLMNGDTSGLQGMMNSFGR